LGSETVFGNKVWALGFETATLEGPSRGRKIEPPKRELTMF